VLGEGCYEEGVVVVCLVVSVGVVAVGLDDVAQSLDGRIGFSFGD